MHFGKCLQISYCYTFFFFFFYPWYLSLLLCSNRKHNKRSTGNQKSSSLAVHFLALKKCTQFPRLEGFYCRNKTRKKPKTQARVNKAIGPPTLITPVLEWVTLLPQAVGLGVSRLHLQPWAVAKERRQSAPHRSSSLRNQICQRGCTERKRHPEEAASSPETRLLKALFKDCVGFFWGRSRRKSVRRNSSGLGFKQSGSLQVRHALGIEGNRHLGFSVAESKRPRSSEGEEAGRTSGSR